MKNITLTILLLILVLDSSAQHTDKLIPTGVIQNTLLLKEISSSSEGFIQNTCTGFVLSHNNKLAIITAKHFFSKDIINGSYQTFEYFSDNKWQSLMAKVFFNEKYDVDVVVIPISGPSNKGMKPSLSVDYGANSYILGFPNSWSMNVPDLSKTPIPITKHGIISAFFLTETPKFILTDIINIKGYSGAPLITFDYKLNLWCVSGVVIAKVNNPNPNETQFNEQGFTKAIFISEVKTIMDSIP